MYIEVMPGIIQHVDQSPDLSHSSAIYSEYKNYSDKGHRRAEFFPHNKLSIADFLDWKKVITLTV